MLDHVYATGETRAGEGARVLLRTRDGEMQERFLDFSYDAVRDPNGKVIGVFVQGMDRTEAVKTLRHQRLLLDELNHRVKNTLATVQSIAKQTMRVAPDLKSASRDLEGRIVALSKAHDLLSQTAWDSTTIQDLIADEFAHFDQSRITASGPDVLLNPRASIALAMVLHELATNAAKYGALSGDAGHLNVEWEVAPDGEMRIDWRETSERPAAAPSRLGFGSRMIDAVMRGDLNGSVETGYESSGLRCRLFVPLSSYSRATEHA